MKFQCDNIKEFLSKYKLLFVIGAIFLQTHVVYISNRIGSDHLLQIASSHNFMNGHGFSIPSIDTNRICVKYKFLEDWPLGFNVIVLPFLILTNNNIELSEQLLYLISFTLIFFVTYKILKSIIPPEKQWWISLLFIFFMFAFTPFRHLAVVDLLDIGIYLWILYLIQVFFKKSHKILHEYFIILSISLLSASLSFFRYAYYPHTFSIFCFFLLGAIFFKKKISLKYFVYSIIILGVSLSYIYFQFSTQSFSSDYTDIYLSSPVSLSEGASKLLYPTFFNAFFTDYTIYKFYFIITNNSSISLFLFYLFSIVSIILFIIFVVITFKAVNKSFELLFKRTKQNSDNENSLKNFLLSSSFFTILCNLVFIFFVYKGIPLQWKTLLSKISLIESFPVISRYVALTYFLTLIVFFIYIAMSQKNHLRIFIFWLFITSFVFQFSHWLYLRNKFSFFNREKYMVEINQPTGSYCDLMNLTRYISNEKKQILYINSETEIKNNYRQLHTGHFILSNGGISIDYKSFKSISDNPFFLKSFKVLFAIHQSEPENSERNQFLTQYNYSEYINLKNCKIKVLEINSKK